jgi:hypothetical protein
MEAGGKRKSRRPTVVLDRQIGEGEKERSWKESWKLISSAGLVTRRWLAP